MADQWVAHAGLRAAQVVCRSDDRHVELADTVDVALEPVTPVNGANTRWGAGENEIAGPKLEQSGQEGDLVRDVPDHLGQVAGLLAHAIDVEPDRAPGWVFHMLRRNECGARGGVLEGLSHFPRTLELFGFGLQVAACHVDADG